MLGNQAFQHPFNTDCRIKEGFLREAPLRLPVQ